MGLMEFILQIVNELLHTVAKSWHRSIFCTSIGNLRGCDRRLQDDLDMCRRSLEEKSRQEDQAQKDRRVCHLGSRLQGFRRWDNQVQFLANHWDGLRRTSPLKLRGSLLKRLEIIP